MQFVPAERLQPFFNAGAASQILRVRAHPHFVGRAVKEIRSTPDVIDDYPLGIEMLRLIVKRPQSPAAASLQTGVDWEDLKFLFLGSFKRDWVSYLRWDHKFGTFFERDGDANFKWLDDFRTVHGASAHPQDRSPTPPQEHQP